MEKQSKAAPGLWRIAVWGVIAAIILTPAVAMQFTDEVNWTALDFTFAAVLLGGAALLFEAARFVIRGRRARVFVGLALIAAVMIVWAEAAVGIFH